MANFAAYEIQDPIDFLGRNASEFHHTATSTSTNYGADGYTTYYGWDRNGNGSVDWYDANGDSKIDLQSGEYDERCPSWSPFSRYVKYISGSGPYYTCDLNPDAGGRYWYDENTSFDVIVHQGVGRDADTATADREEHMFAMALAQQLISHWAYNTGISDSVTNKWSYKYWLMRDFYFAPDANDSVNPCGAGEFSMADADATSSTVLSPVGLVYEKAVEDQNFTWWGSGTWNASSGSCFASESWPARPNSQLPSGW